MWLSKAVMQTTVVLSITLSFPQCWPQPRVAFTQNPPLTSSLLQSKSQNSKNGLGNPIRTGPSYFSSPVISTPPSFHPILTGLLSTLYKKHILGVWLCCSLSLESSFPDIHMVCFLTCSRCLIKIHLPRPSETTLHKIAILLAVFHFVDLNITNIICLLIDCFSPLDGKLQEDKDVCILHSLLY